MKHTVLMAVAALATITAIPAAQAHHAINAQYDVDKTVSMKGTLKQIDWINPHAFFHFDVTGKDGKVTTWALESPGPAALRRVGLSNKNLFKIGDTYSFTTSPARNGKPLGTFGSVTFADGRKINIAAVDPAAAGR